MPIEILMPALSPTMTEGNLAKWLKKEGEKIESGDVIAEIETDKATMEVEAVDEGIMGKILVASGTENVPVNQVIALLLEDDEDISVLDNYEAATIIATSVEVEKPKEKIKEATALVITNSGERIIASPLAKRIAQKKGVDISAIKGTGANGRIIKADVEEYNPAINVQATYFGRNSQEYIEIPNNNMRKVIAKRLSESKQTIPHFYLSVDCELDNLLVARKKMNDVAPKIDNKPTYKISVNDFVIKAVAMALRDVPEANSSWTDSNILQYNNVDVSVAVAIDGGLITPIIRNADQKSLAIISTEMKDLASRAKQGKLAPEEFQGGGFSISNLGMFGIKQFNAIVNPPQSCILAIGAGEERVVVRNGEFKVANIVTITLSSDHRVVDGAIGATFLAAFKKYMQDPVMMVV